MLGKRFPCKAYIVKSIFSGKLLGTIKKKAIFLENLKMAVPGKDTYLKFKNILFVR